MLSGVVFMEFGRITGPAQKTRNGPLLHCHVRLGNNLPAYRALFVTSQTTRPPWCLYKNHAGSVLLKSGSTGSAVNSDPWRIFSRMKRERAVSLQTCRGLSNGGDLVVAIYLDVRGSAGGLTLRQAEVRSYVVVAGRRPARIAESSFLSPRAASGWPFLGRTATCGARAFQPRTILDALAARSAMYRP